MRDDGVENDKDKTKVSPEDEVFQKWFEHIFGYIRKNFPSVAFKGIKKRVDRGKIGEALEIVKSLSNTRDLGDSKFGLDMNNSEFF